MIDHPTAQSRLRRLAAAALILAIVGALAAIAIGVVYWIEGHEAIGWGFTLGGIVALLIGVLLFCQVVLFIKFLSYLYRAYEVLLASAEFQRRQEEHTRTIAENSGLSEWAKRVVYREKDYDYLRDTIHGALVRQDWETAEHLIRDMGDEFGYHDEAAALREKLEQARMATIDERLATAVARFNQLCDQHKWAQAQDECQRLQSLYPDEPRIERLSQEIDERREAIKQKLMGDYEEAVRADDVDRAHRLLFALDQYLIPREAESLKQSARTVFRARMEQIKTRFSIAVSYKQFHNAIAAGEQLIREFPNSGYAREISKLMPVLRQRAREQKSPPHVAPASRSTH